MHAHLIPLLCLAACASTPRSKVLIIGIDGLRPDQLEAAHTPAMDGLAADGLRRLDATNVWTEDEPSNGHSAPNWAAVLTGLRPARTEIAENGDGDHLIDDDTWTTGKVRTIFGHAKHADVSLQTAAFHTWPGIGLAQGTILARSKSVLDAHLCPGGDGSSAERDIDVAAAAENALLQRDAYAGLDPDLLFVYFSQVDAAGHEHTYEDPDYRAAIESADSLVARVLAAIQARPNRDDERWLVLLTSDHGGPSSSTSHGDNGDPDVRTVPVLGSADGHPFTQPAKVSIYDVVPTALAWLAIETRVSFDGKSLLE